MADTDADLLAEGDLVADYLEELLDIADLDGDIENSVKRGAPTSRLTPSRNNWWARTARSSMPSRSLPASS